MKNVALYARALLGKCWPHETSPVIDNHFTTQFFSSVGYYNIWYWDPSEDGDVTRSGNVIHETGAAANDNL